MLLFCSVLSSRSGDVVEPRLKDQWFVDCSKMADHAAQVVASFVVSAHSVVFRSLSYSPHIVSWFVLDFKKNYLKKKCITVIII